MEKMMIYSPLHRRQGFTAGVLTVLLTAALAFGGVISSADARGGFGRANDASRDGGWRFARLAHYLDLSDEQREQVTELSAEVADQVEILREERASHLQALWALVQADSADEAAILEQIDAAGAVANDMAVLRLELKLDIYRDVLTAEQQAEFDARLASRFDDGDDDDDDGDDDDDDIIEDVDIDVDSAVE